MNKVVITTAIALSKSQLASIKKAVESKYGKDMSYEEKLDPRILGGLVLNINSRQIDTSLKTKLEHTKQLLLENIQNS